MSLARSLVGLLAGSIVTFSAVGIGAVVADAVEGAEEEDEAADAADVTPTPPDTPVDTGAENAVFALVEAGTALVLKCEGSLRQAKI